LINTALSALVSIKTQYLPPPPNCAGGPYCFHSMVAFFTSWLCFSSAIVLRPERNWLSSPSKDCDLPTVSSRAEKSLTRVLVGADQKNPKVVAEAFRYALRAQAGGR
jgi:hypothetical protein